MSIIKVDYGEVGGGENSKIVCLDAITVSAGNETSIDCGFEPKYILTIGGRSNRTEIIVCEYDENISKTSQKMTTNGKSWQYTVPISVNNYNFIISAITPTGFKYYNDGGYGSGTLLKVIAIG